MAEDEKTTESIPTEDLDAFVEEQIAGNRRATKLTWIVGAVLILLVGCYMSGLVLLVRGMLVPMTAARMIAQSVEQGLPAILGETERSLHDQAVPLANALSDRLIIMLPELRKKGQEQIDLACDQWLPLLREEIRSVVQAYMLEHEAEFRLVYESQKEEGFADVFVDQLVKEVAASLQAELLQDGKGRGLDYVGTMAMGALNDINGELSRLLNLSGDEMTRSDRLQRRLIVAWMQVLDEMLRYRRLGIPAPIE